MIDIIYQYVEGAAAWEEIRYSLRSLEKNAKFKYKVWFVGDKPAWAQNVGHIPITRKYDDFFTNCLDAGRKMNAVLLHPEIGKNFIYMYDDIYLVNPVRLKDMKAAHALKPIVNGTPGTSKHFKLKVRTKDALQKIGRCADKPSSVNDVLQMRGDYFIDFETHLPKYYNKAQMIEVFQKFLPMKNRLLFSTLYNNYHRPAFLNFLEKGNTVKAEFFGDAELAFCGSASDTVQECKEAMEKCLFMNHNNAGLTLALEEVLQEMFADKSKFEK